MAGNIVWADEEGEFLLGSPGWCIGWGNPGCDECGTYDAIVKVDGVYLCLASAQEKGIFKE